jgi:hypothetical protein
MSSELVVDKLTGRGTPGVITVTLENSESQTLQQGLAKVTANILVNGTSNADASLNVSGVVDGSAGINTLTISNPFSAIKSAVPNMENHDSSYNRGTNVDDASASVFILRIHQSSSGSLTDSEGDLAITIHGDLA